MKKRLLLGAWLLPWMIMGQNSLVKKIIPKMELTGFVRSDVIVDSRQNQEALQGAYTSLPKDVFLDANGEDINAAGSTRSLGLMSRLGFKATGPQVLGAAMSAYIEIDMAAGAGDGATNEVRFRHAWLKMQWERTQLLTGRAWHPMFTEESFPIVLNLNTGVPFQPFSRSPQVRVTQRLGEHLSLMGTLLWQSQYENSGPQGNTPKYQRDAMIPNVDLMVKYQGEHWRWGVAYDVLTLKPALYTEGTLGKFKADKLLFSHRAMAYGRMNYGGFSLLGKAVYGQNMNDLAMQGGYAATAINPETGRAHYTNSTVVSAYLQARYQLKGFTFGLFGAYLQNLGFGQDLSADAEVYASLKDIHAAWRVTPNAYYRQGKLQFGLEYEYTVASYGTLDFEDRGRVKNTHNVENHRVMANAVYFF